MKQTIPLILTDNGDNYCICPEFETAIILRFKSNKRLMSMKATENRSSRQENRSGTVHEQCNADEPRMTGGGVIIMSMTRQFVLYVHDQSLRFVAVSLQHLELLEKTPSA